MEQSSNPAVGTSLPGGPAAYAEYREIQCIYTMAVVANRYLLRGYMPIFISEIPTHSASPPDAPGGTSLRED